MKRSEMIEHIAAEMVDAAVYRKKLSNENEESYYKRKAADILDMLLGFGMLPPYNPYYLDHGSIMDCQWDPEDEEGLR